MSVVVKPIKATKSEIKKYVQFGIDLYKGNDCFVPPIVFDEIDTLLPEKNPVLPDESRKAGKNEQFN